MARTVLNPAIRVFSGNLSGYVYRMNADGSITTAMAPMRNPDRVPTGPQAAQMARFKQASAHCQLMLADPATLALYRQVQAKHGPMARLRSIMMGDVMKAPKITSVDVSKYHGAVGDIITVKAEDNVAVARVTVTILDQTNAQVIETLNYVPAPEQLAESVEWLFKAATAVPAGHTAAVQVTAYDLAGNTFEVSQPV
jgi:hypothetical protein